MRIAFTGHRNKTVSPHYLAALAAQHPGAVWVHGGAKGFDSQVAEFAKAHSIPTEVIPPDYARHGRGAPLIRNRAIVDGADLLVACFDGRTTGGTAYTIRYAEKHRKPVIILSPIQNQEIAA